jgi:hypothetical protein
MCHRDIATRNMAAVLPHVVAIVGFRQIHHLMEADNSNGGRRGQSAADEPGVGADRRKQQPGNRDEEQRGRRGQLPQQLPVKWSVLEDLVPDGGGHRRP